MSQTQQDLEERIAYLEKDNGDLKAKMETERTRSTEKTTEAGRRIATLMADNRRLRESVALRMAPFVTFVESLLSGLFDTNETVQKQLKDAKEFLAEVDTPLKKD